MSNIFIVRNGKQEGPFDLQSLRDMHISPETLVWYKGLDNWVPASQADATAGLFSQPQQPDYASQSEPAPYQPEPASQPEPQPYQQEPAYQPEEEPYMPECPGNYLALNIVAMVLGCCSPCCLSLILGIVGLIYSLKVKKTYDAGDYEGACAASKNAKIWGIIAICLVGLGIIFNVIYYGFLGGMTALQDAMNQIN